LIYPDDAKEFAGIMDIVWQSLGRNPVDKTTKQYWFAKLQHLPMGDVSNAFDNFLMTKSAGDKELPTIKDILHIAKPREFNKALTSQRSEEATKDGLARIAQAVSEGIKPKKDYRAWAKEILQNQKQYPDIAVRFAKEAIGIKEDVTA